MPQDNFISPAIGLYAEELIRIGEYAPGCGVACEEVLNGIPVLRGYSKAWLASMSWHGYNASGTSHEIALWLET